MDTSAESSPPEKEQAKKAYSESLGRSDNLTPEEVGELVAREFDIEPSGIVDEVRGYYLKLKSEKPDKAQEMLVKLGQLPNIADLDSVVAVSTVLGEYISGAVVHGVDSSGKKIPYVSGELLSSFY